MPGCDTGQPSDNASLCVQSAYSTSGVSPSFALLMATRDSKSAKKKTFAAMVVILVRGVLFDTKT